MMKLNSLLVMLITCILCIHNIHIYAQIEGVSIRNYSQFGDDARHMEYASYIQNTLKYILPENDSSNIGITFTYAYAFSNLYINMSNEELLNHSLLDLPQGKEYGAAFLFLYDQNDEIVFSYGKIAIPDGFIDDSLKNMFLFEFSNIPKDVSHQISTDDPVYLYSTLDYEIQSLFNFYTSDFNLSERISRLGFYPMEMDSVEIKSIGSSLLSGNVSDYSSVTIGLKNSSESNFLFRSRLGNTPSYLGNVNYIISHHIESSPNIQMFKSAFDEFMDASTDDMMKIWFHFYEDSLGNLTLNINSYITSDNEQSIQRLEVIMEGMLTDYLNQSTLDGNNDGRTTNCSFQDFINGDFKCKGCWMDENFEDFYIPGIVHEELAFLCGVFDGLMGVMQIGVIYQEYKKNNIFGLEFWTDFVKTVAIEVLAEGSSGFTSGIKKKYHSTYEYWSGVYGGAFDLAIMLFDSDARKSLANQMWQVIKISFGDLAGLNGRPAQAYFFGIIAFEILIAYLTAGSGTAIKAASNSTKVVVQGGKGVGAAKHVLLDPGSFRSSLSSALCVASNTGSLLLRNLFRKMKIILHGCFTKHTPVYLASNSNQFSLKNPIQGFALATLPFISLVPIQEVHLFDYAIAHKSVNTSYGLTAHVDDTYIIGKDPYTSDQQRSRDHYEINDTDWYEVIFEQVMGSSKCKLAFHNDWIAQNNYYVYAVVNMNLPEQGISGSFRITSIKHILPQKKPESNPGDDYEWKPVTGLFIHESNQVSIITFDNGDTLGVTATHPIFSTTYNTWRLAGELEIGEKVLTFDGEATVTSVVEDTKPQEVYNLEIKDLHNFLVGDLGVVVHNICEGFWNKVVTYAGGIKEFALDHIWKGHSFSNKIPGKTYFSQSMTKQKIKDLVNEMLMDPKVDWQFNPGGRELRALVDGTKYPGFPSTIGHNTNGSILNTIRVTVIDDGGTLLIKNAFPSSSIGF